MNRKKRNARVCPKCGQEQSHVEDTRVDKKTQILQRRRVCRSCGTKWMTVEINKSLFAALVQMSKANKGKEQANNGTHNKN